ncbi:hypothetical protein OB960_06670 [Halobacteria archaeon AArc-xg1-1]|uniref:Uncharacterized protein n=1 Tax=Natronoglomus mannanivorans TaxID=2979990 RepID=A0AAP3E148_9EURY|nr:hypothetical protein [Halobacteria archaeon AArc-xg1-1]
MAPSTVTDRQRLPTRLVHDSSANRLAVVVDVLPATVDDLTVTVGSTQLRVTCELPDEYYERTIVPPRRHRFTDERKAIYNNGVLSVSIGTVRWRDQRVTLTR